MNHEQFIEKELRNCRVGEHPMSVDLTDEVVERTLSLYRENQFHNLDGLISKAMDEINLKSRQVNLLSRPGGMTSKEYADVSGICLATARVQLKKSMLANCNKDKRPYIWTLKDAS